jgi:2-polyprenyl-6-methoxyphenol hydroxylase-like FAD-dependent oxidoreductase
MRASTQVLIVGAGPTGLVLALWLTKLGVTIRIIDKNHEAAAFSRALGVQARTLEYYDQIGLAKDVVERGVRIQGVNLWVRGKKAARLPFEHLGEGLTRFPFVLDFAQDQHERLLVDRLAALGVRVQRDTELRRLEHEPDRVRATLRHASGEEELCEAIYVAGCDGSHSVVREQLGIGFPGSTYDQLFYVADVDASGPVTDGELHVDLDEADLLAIFPMKGERHVRLVGTVYDKSHTAGNLTFSDVSQRGIGQLRLSVDKVNWFAPYHVHHRVADTFRKGRAFLLGDAAHIHSPVGAQGMNTGIGDAINLAWKLAAVVGQHANERLLDTYEPERIAFARRLVATTDRIFTFASHRGAIAARVRTQLLPLLAPALLGLVPVRRFVFRTVSQLGVHYRVSPLSEGSAGSVHGGDRLPWVDMAGTDNFAPLASLSWQVHVYGEPSRGFTDRCAELDLPVQTFAWSPAAEAAGFMKNASYLVRPDGYIGLADPSADPARLTRYVTTFRR